MKKIVLTLLLVMGVAYANSGEEIYKAKCAMCHKMQGMMSQNEMQQMRQKMQNATPEQRAAMKQSMMEKMKKSDMKAPPMPMVSKRLKMKLADKEAFIAFVDDYIQNPSQSKGYCMPMAYKRFGTMPPIGKAMKEQERIAVATWLYDNFKGSWGESAEGKMCDMRNKGMKCGSGKCGGGNASAKSTMKCGAGKCGSGKCGSK